MQGKEPLIPQQHPNKVGLTRYDILRAITLLVIGVVTLFAMLTGIGALAAFHHVFGPNWHTISGFGGALLRTLAAWASSFNFQPISLPGVIAIVATQGWICLTALYSLCDRTSAAQLFPSLHPIPTPNPFRSPSKFLSAVTPTDAFRRIWYAWNPVFWGVVIMESLKSGLLNWILPQKEDQGLLSWVRQGVGVVLNCLFWLVLCPLRGVEQLVKVPAFFPAALSYGGYLGYCRCRKSSVNEAPLLSGSVSEQLPTTPVSRQKNDVQHPSDQSSAQHEELGEDDAKSVGSDLVWMEREEEQLIDRNDEIYYELTLSPNQTQSSVIAAWNKACDKDWTENDEDADASSAQEVLPLKHRQLKSPINREGFGYYINLKESMQNMRIQLTVCIDNKQYICEMRGLQLLPETQPMTWFQAYLRRQVWVLKKMGLEQTEEMQVLFDMADELYKKQQKLQEECSWVRNQIVTLRGEVTQHQAHVEQQDQARNQQIHDQKQWLMRKLEESNARIMTKIEETTRQRFAHQQNQPLEENSQSGTPRRKGSGFQFNGAPPPPLGGDTTTAADRTTTPPH